MKAAAISVAVALVGFAGVTWWALESGGVAIVSTRPADEPKRRTHVWYAELDGALWLEAGTPRNPWFVDLENDRNLHLSTDEMEGRYRALPSRDPEDQRRVRNAIRAKYGWRDRWVGIYIDSSQSIPVRLRPISGDD